MRRTTQEGPSVLSQKLLRRLPPRQQDLIETATVLGERRGIPVYLVGGPVRDLVLGRISGDLDLTVEGNATAYAKALAAQLGARVTIHPQFGTATILLQDGLRLDVATARRERYPHPAALPRVSPGTIAEDLSRRDFSINAMAIRLAPRGGELLDPFGGLQDLTEGHLRALHQGSYRDDPTRIFRGARYAARYRLRFSRRDRVLVRAALAEKVLQRLSTDRLFHEVKLILSEPIPETALSVLQGLGVLKTLHPALALDVSTVAQMRQVRRTWERYGRLTVSPKPLLWRVYLLVLLLSVPSRVRLRVGRRLGLKGPALDQVMRDLNDIPRLQKKLEQPRIRLSRLRHAMDDASADLRLLVWASGSRRVRNRVQHYLTRLASVTPALTGRDLRKLGIPPGPIYRQILDLLLEGRLEERL
ncbi:MAG: CCA tRNA nucleotidyltransferase, partial [Candidatus Methylomirabilales bacterium]